MLQPRLVFGLGLLLLTGSASAVILQFKSKAFALHGDANRKDNVYFLNRDKENSEGYVYTTSEVGETLGLLENDWTFGSLVAFTSADHCSGSLFWFTFGANPNCFKSGKLDSCSGVSVVVDVNGDTFQDGSEPGVYLAKDGKVVDYADYTFSRGTTEFVMDVTIDDNSNNLYANFEFNGEGIFSGKKADGYDISFADGDLRSKHNKHISEKFAFGSLGGTCGQVHRIKSTTLEVTGHVWSKKNQKALKKLVVESGGWHGFSSLAAQIQEELLDGQPGTWAALMLGVAGAAAAFVVVNMATARRRRLGAEGQPYQAVSKNYQAAGAV